MWQFLKIRNRELQILHERGNFESENDSFFLFLFDYIPDKLLKTAGDLNHDSLGIGIGTALHRSNLNWHFRLSAFGVRDGALRPSVDILHAAARVRRRCSGPEVASQGTVHWCLYKELFKVLPLNWLEYLSPKRFKATSAKGASIYDVRTEVGGGVSPKEDIVREVAWI